MNIRFLSVLFLMTLLITSCEKNLQPEQIIGQWKVVKANFQALGWSDEVLQEMKEDSEKQVYYFKSDNRLEIDLGTDKGRRNAGNWEYNTKQQILYITSSLTKEMYEVTMLNEINLSFRATNEHQTIEFLFERID